MTTIAEDMLGFRPLLMSRRAHERYEMIFFLKFILPQYQKIISSAVRSANGSQQKVGLFEKSKIYAAYILLRGWNGMD